MICNLVDKSRKIVGNLKSLENHAERVLRRNGKMAESKKEWVTPELIVLTRSKPEEAVLSGCKSIPGAGPESSNARCLQSFPSCTTFCVSQATS
jgi:hypothetical protein